MKEKICTKCGDKHPATAEYFHKNKMGKHGLRSCCRKCRNENERKYRQRYPERIKKQQKQYTQTINGYLRHIFGYMKYRCNNPSGRNACYKDIELKFTVDEFIDYVTVDLGYDTYEKIKGLTVDRIDSNGHYEKGNIRFVTQTENNRNKRKNDAY